MAVAARALERGEMMNFSEVEWSVCLLEKCVFFGQMTVTLKDRGVK